MQIKAELYNPVEHDRYKCLTVKQPFADLLTCCLWRNDLGENIAAKSIEVRSKDTSYRGELLICSSKKPELYGRLCGVTCGFVELYDTKPVEQFTARDWAATCIPEGMRPKTGYGWYMRNPRRVIEMPIKGQLGFYNLIVPKGDIMEYPRDLMIGPRTFRKLREL